MALSAFALMGIIVYAAMEAKNAGLSYLFMNQKKYEKITKKLSCNDDELDFNLCFNGQVLAYDEALKTFYLPLDYENDEWENGELATDSKQSVFLLEDIRKKDKKEYMAGNVSIPIVMVDQKQYQTANLVITGMPVISFDSCEAVTNDGSPLFEARLYEDLGQKGGVKEFYTTAALRGNTSLSYEKKSLRLKLFKQNQNGEWKKENKNLLGIRKDNDWILNSLYADNTRIRDKMAIDLWQEVGAKNNPFHQNYGIKGEYVEVVINHGYAGIYLLTHPIDKKQLGMDSVSNQLERGADYPERIYKKKYTHELTSGDFIGDLPDLAMPNFRGGFYLKGDTVLQNEEEWKPLYELSKTYEAQDEEFAEDIAQRVNMNNLMDNWLFFQAIGGFDNENKNIYYIAKNEGNQYKGYFIPWDLNISFGAVYADNPYYCEESMDSVNQVICFEPAQRAVELNVNQCRNYLKKTWESWKKSGFDTEQLLEKMDALSGYLRESGALQREMQRWPNGNADTDLSHMKEFTKKRIEFVDGLISSEEFGNQ